MAMHWLWVPLALALLLCVQLQGISADLVHVDLASLKGWTLSNANQSISLATAVPAHALSVLAAEGVVQADPLHRYGERDTRWVSEERWNFTLIWHSKKHRLLDGCRQLLLVLHGLDTHATVVLNGRHVLQADNVHRSWWVVLPGPQALREGANMLSVVLQPAAEVALRAKAAYPYPVPTMQVPGAVDAYNFARKPASDFGWDWGPAFVPAGITGGVELVGFDRATLIGALVVQSFNASADCFDLLVTAQFVVPAAGDNGTLSLTLAVLDLRQEQQVELRPGEVTGNQLQALVTMPLQVPAARVQRWQPLSLAPKGKPRELYDLAVMFEPTEQTPTDGDVAATCGIEPDDSSSSSSSGGRWRDQPPRQHSSSDHSSSNEGRDNGDGSSSSTSSSSGGQGYTKAPVPELRSTIVRRIGFRTVELVQEPIQAASRELLGQHSSATHQHSQQQQEEGSRAAQQQQGVGPASASPQQQQQQQGADQPAGESFYFRVNGVPLFAKGANLIPLHVLSTAVTEGRVRALLQSAVDANMNMIRIWGGGRYQIDELYDAADELGLMVWQEAMFACSPYPRDPSFLSNVGAEVTQQLLRLGSHASLVVFGGNNEVEQSLEWYPETRGNLAMYATDYSSLFQGTVGKKVQQMLPHTPWVDSSPSRGSVLLPGAAKAPQTHAGTPTAPAAAGIAAADAAAAASATAAGAASAQAAGQVQQTVSHNHATEPSDAPPARSLLEASWAGRPTAVEQAAAAGASGAGAVHVKRWGSTNDPLYGDVHFYNYRDDCQDWHTYPQARFVSEYGWQSYPSWSTYAAATAAEDWQVTSDMTEYRQRHPNGTVELLAQLQRRFKLPQAWLDLLPQQQQHKQQQQQQQHPVHDSPQQPSAAGLLSVTQAWPACLRLASRAAVLAQQWLTGLWSQHPADTAAPASAAVLPPAGAALSSNGLKPGSLSDTQPAAPIAAGRPGRSSSSSSSVQQSSDMQHFVYLTQLQQLLCYETALHTWRRLRSDPATLSMGVLYWQLNDVWAGASWSSVDYGGVWKPVHYGVARAFADVTLSVQHDLQQDTISVYAINDLQAPVDVQLAVRLLSLTDAAAHCQPPSDTGSTTTSSSSSSNVVGMGPGVQSAPYIRHQQLLKSAAPAAAATLLWSKPVPALLKASGGSCNRSSCYVHIGLTAEGHAGQEATVWLAPFRELPLQDPQLVVEGLQGGPDSTPAAAADADLTTALAGVSSSSGSSSPHQQQQRQQEGVSFRVSSQAVAAFAVWEVQESAGGILEGHFSDNVVTIHPCEPRQVTFWPRAGNARWHGSSTAGSSGGGGSSSSSSSSSSSGSSVHRGASRRDGEASRGEQRGPAAGGSQGSGGQGSAAVLQGADLSRLLQEHLVVTSLWDHQQFDTSAQRDVQQERVAVV